MARATTPSETPIFDALQGGKVLARSERSWTGARARADKALAEALRRPTKAPDAGERQALVEAHGWA